MLEGVNSIAHESWLVANWARYKRYLVIALGLNKHCSLINHELFNRLRHYINAVEQIANKLYVFGIRQFLLPAVIRY
jgi:hypothetical protein